MISQNIILHTSKASFCNFFLPTSLNAVDKHRARGSERWCNNSISKDSISYQVQKAIYKMCDSTTSPFKCIKYLKCLEKLDVSCKNLRVPYVHSAVKTAYS